MNDCTSSEKSPPAHTNDTGRRIRSKAVNRILLYARGLDLDAASGLRLAMAAREGAGPDAGMEAIISAMHTILREKNSFQVFADDGVAPLASAPRPRRRPMVSEGHQTVSLLRSVLRLAGIGKKTWKNAAS